MNTNELIQTELRRISKEIKEILNNDGDASKRELIANAISKYNLTKDEEIQLNVLLANCK